MSFIEYVKKQDTEKPLRKDFGAGFSDCIGYTMMLCSRENEYGEPYSAYIGKGFDGSRDCIGLGFNDYIYSYDACEYMKGQGFGDGICYYEES